MNRPGFGGDSFNFSTGISRNGDGDPADLTEEDLDDLRIELMKVEDEIQTLRQVLFAKEKYAVEIKRQLGIGPISDLKQNLAKGWQEVQTSTPYLSASATLEDISRSNAYKRTQETLSHAGQVTTAALSSVGVAITRRLGEMRHSSTFKSFGDMVGNVKDKMTGSQSNQSSYGFDRSSSRDGPF